MDSLVALQSFFKSVGKEVTDMTGISLKADGFQWELVHEDPVRNGIVMAPVDWKAYVKALKANLPAPELKQPEIEAKMADVAKSLGIGKMLPIKQTDQITCPHCGKSGGSAGMKIHHFDRCKQKSN